MNTAANNAEAATELPGEPAALSVGDRVTYSRAIALLRGPAQARVGHIDYLTKFSGLTLAHVQWDDGGAATIFVDQLVRI